MRAILIQLAVTAFAQPRLERYAAAASAEGRLLEASVVEEEDYRMSDVIFDMGENAENGPNRCLSMGSIRITATGDDQGFILVPALSIRRHRSAFIWSRA